MAWETYWTGIYRTFGNLRFRTTYKVNYISSASGKHYITLDSLKFTSLIENDFSGLLPLKAVFTVNGTRYPSSGQWSSGTTVSREGDYYVVTISKSTAMSVPVDKATSSNNGTFTISVAITANNENTMTFTETCPSLRTAGSIYFIRDGAASHESSFRNGRLYKATLSKDCLNANGYSTKAEVWSYNDPDRREEALQVLKFSDGYYNATTLLQDSTVNQAEFYFTPYNFEGHSSKAYFTNVILETYYQSSDFFSPVLCMHEEFDEDSSGTALNTYFSDSTTISSSIKPVVTITATSTKMQTAENTDYFFQSESEIVFSANVVFQYGGALKKIEVTAGLGIESKAIYDTTYSGTPTSYGNETFSFAVYDTKGANNTGTILVHVLEYSPPRINACNIHRCKQVASQPASGTYYTDSVTSPTTYYVPDDQNGTFCAIEVSAIADYLEGYNSGSTFANLNFLSGGTRYSSGTHSWFFSRVTIDGKYVLQAVRTIVINAPAEQSFNITLTLQDRLEQTVSVSRLSTAGVLMDFYRGGNGLALGKIAEHAKTLDMASDWELNIYNGKIVIVNYLDNSGHTYGTQELTAWMRSIESRIASLSGSGSGGSGGSGGDSGGIEPIDDIIDG